MSINAAMFVLCQSISIVPALEDSSIIKQSIAIPNAADQNFGMDEEITVGNYHVTAEGLVKFSLEDLKYVEKVELVFKSPRVVGSFPSTFVLTKTESNWAENSVTWNTRPADQFVIGDIQVGSEDLAYDLTTLALEAVANGESQLSLKIASKGTASLFLQSKEKTPGEPSIYLNITSRQPHTQPTSRSSHRH